jgi:RHS repeat-associated protein
MRSGNLGGYRYGFQSQEIDGEIKGEGLSVNYKYRMHDPRLGRFFAVDPLADDYPYNSVYAFSENRVVDGVELEGREFFFPTFTTTPLLGVADVLVMESAMGRGIPPTVIETVKPRFRWRPSSSILERFRRGSAAETEQLEKLGLEKNTSPIKGSEGTSIPDAMLKGGKQTLEIKDVKYQSLTRQLRIQQEFSGKNGTNPLLRIKEGAVISEQLKNSNFEISFYEIAPIVPKVNIVIGVEKKPAVKKEVTSFNNKINRLENLKLEKLNLSEKEQKQTMDFINTITNKEKP